PLKQARAGQNTSQAVYGSDCLRSVEPGYQGAISAAFSKREKQNAGAWCRNAQAGANLLWCCKTSEPIPPTSSRLSCCERFGEMVSTVRAGFLTISDILRRSDIFVAIALRV